MPTRAVAYIRVSDEGGRGDDLMSPQIQTAAIRDYCRTRGYRIVETIEDIDLSGRFWKRRQIERAVTLIEARQADVIVVWKVSRVARNRLDWAVAVDRVQQAGGQLESATEPVDASTSTGRFTRGVLAELAAFESERIGEGWREAHRQRFEAGLPVNGRVPFGWINERRTIRPHPDEAPLVVEMYRRYLAGESLMAIMDWLQAANVPTHTGARWHPNTIRAILDNPIHAGMVEWQGQRRQGAHDPIVPVEVWERYMANRRDVRRRGTTGVSQHLLVGLLRCARCGHSMCSTTGAKYKDGNYRPRYICSHGQATRAHGLNSVMASKVEAKVWDWLVAKSAELDAARDAAPLPDAPAVSLAVLDQAVSRASRKLATAVHRSLDEDWPADMWNQVRGDLEGQLRAAKVALQGALDRSRLVSDEPSRAAADLVNDWDLLAVTARRAALRELIDRIEVRIHRDSTVTVTIHEA